MKFDYTNPGYWPTQEEVLEVNARSIISDCRGLISGTLIPRPLGNISGVWVEYASVNKVRARKVDADERIQKHRVHKTDRAQVRRLKRILVAKGMTPQVAYKKALDLLKGQAK